MILVVYDNRDHPTAKYRDVSYRVFDGDGRLLLSGLLFAEDPRGYAVQWAKDIGAELDYHGPDEPQATPPVDHFAKLNELRESHAKSQTSLF